MPLYDYICTKCGDHKQQIVKVELRNAVAPICPECRVFMERVVANKPEIIFKGGGFYSTDNRK